MIKLYHAPLTRSSRIVWLLEELRVPYAIERVDFTPPIRSFSQKTPFGKVPVLEDGELTMFESGAILEYLLERYGEGRLAPPPGTPARGTFLQWVHFAEATAFPPLGEMARHTLFKPEAERIPAVVVDARERAGDTFAVLEKALDGKDYLLGAEFSGADVMMGYTLQLAKLFGILGEGLPNTNAYFGRLEARPAFQKALGQDARRRVSGS
jgi:glutathione S-transferase